MEILVILLLILLNGLFAMSEIALISARRSNLEMQARQGSAGARQALKLAKDPDRFLSTVQIGITLIGTLVVIIICALTYVLGEDYLADIAVIYVVMSFIAVMVLCKIYIGLYDRRRKEKKHDR